MADVYKVLGQAYPASGSLYDIYTVPGGRSAVVSSVVVCNHDIADAYFRMSIAPSGSADGPEQYLYWDVPLSGNNTFSSVLGLSMAETDVMRVYTSSGSISFSIHGTEVT